jgi:hypothetical protein
MGDLGQTARQGGIVQLALSVQPVLFRGIVPATALIPEMIGAFSDFRRRR